MTSRRFAFLTTLIAWVAGPVSIAAAADDDPPRPNIVFILADDLGWGDVGCYGGDIPTPHIDSLAVQGSRFTSWYAAAPVCTPSRYALVTGRQPHRSRGGLDGVLMMFDPSHRRRGLRPGETTIAELLRDTGYATALIGKWHLGHGDPAMLPTAHGFEAFYGPAGGCVDYWTHRYAFVADWYRDTDLVEERGYATDLLTDEAVRFIETSRPERPFFLYVSHIAPHYGKSIDEVANETAGTLVTSPSGAQREDPVTGMQVQPVNTLQGRPVDLARLAAIADEKRRHYAAMVTALDDGVGRVLAALESAGLTERTLVIFTADNGPDRTVSSAGSAGPLRGAKHSLWEGGIRVPCVMRWPGRVPAGVTVRASCSMLDVLPTLCGLAGASTTDLVLDGVDARTLWLGEAPRERDLVWAHRNDRAIRRGRWKLVNGQLYDVVRDPGERFDLASRHPGVHRELEASFEAQRQRRR